MLPEDLGLKTQLLKDLQTKGYLGLMCTSTSTFTLGDFEAQGLYLNRLSLLHFSNPINAFKIVEVSSANLLDDELLGTREDYLRKLDHIGIEVPDSKGFIINRLFFRYLREALVMHCCEGVDRGVIDKVMIGGIGQKMGPFEIIELIGKRTTKLVLLSLYGEIDQKIVEFLDTDD
jgi:3-hydroxybutyryl-CoA dehydrogenase